MDRGSQAVGEAEPGPVGEIGYADAPFGVGYLVAVLAPGRERA